MVPTSPGAASGTHPLAFGLFLLWIAGTVFGFWWFEYRDLRPYPATSGNAMVIFQGHLAHGALAELRDRNASATVIGFMDPGCSCTRAAEDHFDDIETTFARQGVAFKRLSPDKINLPDGVMPASPAAAVIDREGRLRYLGPLSDGAFCAPNEGQFVERALKRIADGRSPQDDGPLSQMSFGCYCDWPSSRPEIIKS
ncbi:MAG: DUF6436 domain-containing protein [Pseudomonadota bacterium]